MKSEQLKDRYQNSLLNVFGMPSIVIDGAKGSVVTDVDGKSYIDLLGGIAVNCLGHNHPQITKALISQSQKIMHHSNFFSNQSTIELAEKLLEISGANSYENLVGKSKVFFTNSGTESVEAALKIVKKHKPNGRLIALTQSFHGRSCGALSLTSKEKYRIPFNPLIPNVELIEANNLDVLENVFSELSIEKYGEIAGIFIETIQGEGGVRSLSAQYIARIRELTKRCNALMVIDEVQTGIGRTGSWFSYQNEAIVASAKIIPDIITMAKSLGGGFPIGGLITFGDKVSNILVPGDHGTTYGGNPLACAVALANIKEIENKELLNRAKEIGIYIANITLKQKCSAVTEVRGCGALIALGLKGQYAMQVVKRCLDEGVIINAVTPDTIRLAPAYNIDVEDLDDALAIVFKVIREVFRTRDEIKSYEK